MEKVEADMRNDIEKKIDRRKNKRFKREIKVKNLFQINKKNMLLAKIKNWDQKVKAIIGRIWKECMKFLER